MTASEGDHVAASGLEVSEDRGPGTTRTEGGGFP